MKRGSIANLAPCRAHGRAYDASRGSLYRIGSFPQWNQLATLLTRPAGDVRVAALAVPEEHTAAGTCRWYEATADATHAERICWSRTLKLPLVVARRAGGSWVDWVRVEAAQRDRISAATFHVDSNATHVDLDDSLD
ncbi:MAG: hypothetical protein JWN44_299 [Myxococcales bacterium]|nr:hypothetical protein [Myxococcales bacterium]